MRLAVYLLAVGGFVLLLRLLQRHFLVFCLVALPGTVAHEMTHFLMGLASNGKPTSFNVIPKRSRGGYVLGSVMLSNVRWYNGLFIGLAPLLLLPLAMWLVKWRVSDHHAMLLAHEAAWTYCAASLIHGCMPSMQDMKIAAASVWWAVPAAVLAGYFYLSRTGAIPLL